MGEILLFIFLAIMGLLFFVFPIGLIFSNWIDWLQEKQEYPFDTEESYRKEQERKKLISAVVIILIALAIWIL